MLHSKTKTALGQVENGWQQLQRAPHVKLPDIQLPHLSLPVPSRGVPSLGSIRGSLPRPNLPLPGGHLPAPGLVAVGAGAQALKCLASHRLVRAAISVAENEHVGLLDPYERHRARRRIGLLRASRGASTGGGARGAAAPASVNVDDEEAKVNAADEEAKGTLPVIHPVVDGRLKDVARA